MNHQEQWRTFCITVNVHFIKTDTMLPSGATLVWPYAMPMPMLGSQLCCGRPPITVLALVGAGLGLPLSEEVLVLSLGSTLPTLSGVRRLCVIMWLLVGIVLSDVATVSIGAQLRHRSAALRSRAPRFAGRLLRSVGEQLSVEGRRDAKRLERQLERRLQATSRSATELLAALSRALGPADEAKRAAAPPPPLPLLPAALQRLVRRVTCNTRTALAASGQAGPRVLQKLTQSSAGQIGGLELPYMRTRLDTRGPCVPTSLLGLRGPRRDGAGGGGGGGGGGDAGGVGGDAGRRQRVRASFAAGVDNRVGLGQRWPLALLTGLDRPVEMRSYAAGSALAALAITLPIELLLGVALSATPAAIRGIGAAVATAQLCRFGPLWYAIGRAVCDEVQEQLKMAKAGEAST